MYEKLNIAIATKQMRGIHNKLGLLEINYPAIAKGMQEYKLLRQQLAKLKAWRKECQKEIKEIKYQKVMSEFPVGEPTPF